MAPFLGVPLMDRDHAAIEHMLVEAKEKPDSELLKYFDAISQELRDHFAREEKAMTEARVPVLLCHLELHAQILSEVATLRREIVSRDALPQEI